MYGKKIIEMEEEWIGEAGEKRRSGRGERR